MKVEWHAKDIRSIVISTKTKDNCRLAGKMYGVISDGRSHRIRYIGENGVVYSTDKKHEFIKLPKKQKYVLEVLQRANSNMQQLQLKM